MSADGAEQRTEYAEHFSRCSDKRDSARDIDIDLTVDPWAEFQREQFNRERQELFALKDACVEAAGLLQGISRCMAADHKPETAKILIDAANKCRRALKLEEYT